MSAILYDTLQLQHDLFLTYENATGHYKYYTSKTDSNCMYIRDMKAWSFLPKNIIPLLQSSSTGYT